MINLEMPEDVHTYIREYQGRKKVNNKTGFYSQQQAIIAIIREHMELMKNKSLHTEERAETDME